MLGHMDAYYLGRILIRCFWFVIFYNVSVVSPFCLFFFKMWNCLSLVSASAVKLSQFGDFVFSNMLYWLAKLMYKFKIDRQRNCTSIALICQMLQISLLIPNWDLSLVFGHCKMFFLLACLHHIYMNSLPMCSSFCETALGLSSATPL